jgi:hypothetical protein
MTEEQHEAAARVDRELGDLTDQSLNRGDYWAVFTYFACLYITAAALGAAFVLLALIYVF